MCYLDSLVILGRKNILLSYVFPSQPDWEKSNCFNILQNEKLTTAASVHVNEEQLATDRRRKIFWADCEADEEPHGQLFKERKK